MLSASIECATAADVKMLGTWKVSGGASQKSMDAVEYAGLACKRWDFYVQQDRAISTVQALKKARDAGGDEFAFLTVVKFPAHKKAETGGLCLFRRTWCNHLVVDFLAVNPIYLKGGKYPLSGIGAALLLGVIEMAQVFDCGMIWGEATRESAGNYEAFFGIGNVTDRFEVERKTYLEFKARYFERWPDTGLPLKENLAS